MSDLFLKDNAVNALKKFYLEAWDNQIGTKASPFYAMIKKVPHVSGEEFITAAPAGLSGGVGFGADEGEGNAPDPGAMQYKRFSVPIVNMYATVTIPDRAIQLSSNNAFFDLLNKEIEGVHEAFAWNMGRSIHGYSNGKLASVTASITADATNFKVDDTRNLKEGLIIDIYANGGASPKARRRITNIKRTPESGGGYLVYVNKAFTSAEAITVSGSSYGFITLQNSYGREITGLKDILTENNTIYGVDRSQNIFLNPIVHDMGDTAVLTDDVIDKLLTKAQREKGAEINMLMFSDEAFSAYVRYLRSTNQRYEADFELNGGYKAIRYLSPTGRDIAVVKDEFVSANEVWGVNTDDFTFQKTEMTPVSKDGSMFERVAGSTSLQAVLACYGNLITSRPGGCIRITNAHHTA